MKFWLLRVFVSCQFYVGYFQIGVILIQLLLPNLWLYYFLLAFITLSLDAQPDQKNQEGRNSLRLRQASFDLISHLATAIPSIASVATAIWNRLYVHPLCACVPGGTGPLPQVLVRSYCVSTLFSRK